jgi:hypothetical protein
MRSTKAAELVQLTKLRYPAAWLTLTFVVQPCLVMLLFEMLSRMTFAGTDSENVDRDRIGDDCSK